MKRTIIAIMMILALAVTLAACGDGKETTVTGMVVSVEGTVISLMEMDEESMGDFAEGERPEMPEGMEDFDPSQFEGMTPPEDMTMPENGKMPEFDGENGGMRPGFGGFGENMETTDVDIADAHISIEIDGGKASGTMEDIQAGTFVTVTLNSKGEATYVLVSSQSFLGGGDRRPEN